MNKRQALGALAEDLLIRLGQMREHEARYGSHLAETGTADHDRLMLGYEELEYRLQRIAYRGVKRKAKVKPPDPNQAALFE